MTVPSIQPAFTTGEIAPSLFGRIDVSREHSGAATMRNFYVGFRGGAYSRAGTSFCGFSKQTGRAYPPRLIPFQFSINQGLALEFGNYYMRVIQDGAFVTDVSAAITNISKANPMQITVGLGYQVTAATSVVTGVTSSYKPGDTVTVAGGTYTSPAVLGVSTTQVASAVVSNGGGGGYVPTNTITCSGGTASTNAVLTVATTKVAGGTANVASGGSGGTPNGYGIVQGTTGTGTKFTMQVYIGGSGQIVNIGGGGTFTVVNGGSYTANPSNLANEPVTGISGNAVGLTSAALNLSYGGSPMAVNTVTVSTAGSYSANPGGGALTQGSTSGSGSGATFTATFGPNAATVVTAGTYTAEPSNPVSQASTSGSGVGATFNLTWSSITPGYSIGDWLYVTNVGGMTQVNGNTYVISNISGTVITLADVYGNAINSTSFTTYTSGGLVSRIYTLNSPYSEQDLIYLKYTQSADEMTLCCVNQVTYSEYPVQLLTRTANNNWTIAALSTVPTVSPPSGSLTVQTTSSGSVQYAYQVTSVNPNDGTESIASATGNLTGAVDISTTQGSNTITWAGVAGINEFNVYKAYQSDNAPIPTGALFGYAGTAYGTRFVRPEYYP